MHVIKLRGLPWSCTCEDVVKFLDGVNITTKPTSDPSLDASPSVYLTTNSEGRPSGEAFIELVDENDVEVALKRNNAMMGQRYIEVFRSNQEQLSKHIEESVSNASNWSDPVVRLRGLPYGCTQEDIRTFFDGLNIAFDGILMVIDFSGRFNGEAFVQFDSILDANKALDRHKQKITNRYIEVFRSTCNEMGYYSSNSNASRGKQSNKMNKRNSNMMNNNFDSPYNNNSNNNGNINNNNNNNNGNRQGGNDFNNRNRQKPYSRNMNQNMPNRPRNQQQNGPIPSLMSNYCENNFMNNNNQQYSYNKRPSTPPFPSSQRSRTGLGVRLRGLPYSVNENQIREFFKPLVPTNVVITMGRDGRPSGECECDFDNQNLVNEALKYDKKYIGSRYIEIFPLSSNKVQTSMSINTLMSKDFSNRAPNTPNYASDYNPNSNGGGYMPFDTNSNPMPVPPPPPLLQPQQQQQQQNNMTSLLGIPPVPPPPPPMGQMGANNINEMIFADMAKQMTQLYSQFQTQQQQYYAQAGLNMMNQGGAGNRRF